MKKDSDADKIIFNTDKPKQFQELSSFKILKTLLQFNKPFYYVLFAIICWFYVGAITPWVQPLNVKLIYRLMIPDHHDNW